METTPNTNEPPDTQLAALDVLKMWERGELNNLTPDLLLQLQAVQCLTVALGSRTLTETVA